MLKKTISLSVALVFFCSLGGCQRTPAANIVTSKDTVNMLRIAAGLQRLDVETLPAQFTCDFSNGNNSVHVHANARIHVLGNSFPVCRVIPIDFSQNMVDKITSKFLSGATLYDQQNYVMSKAEVAQEIVSLKNQEAEYELNAMREEYDEALLRLQTQYDLAPETTAPKLVTAKLCGNKVKAGGVEYNYSGIDVGESSPVLNNGRCLYVRNNWWQTSIRGAELTYCDNRRVKAPDRSQISAEDVTGNSTVDAVAQESLHYTPAEAQEKAEILLDQLSLPYSVFDVLLIGDSLKDIDGNYPEDPSVYSYNVRCSRSVSGVGTVLFSVPSMISIDDYNGSWGYEQLNITMNDDGIYRIDWVSPYEVQKTLVQETSLLPYEDVVDIFNRMILYYKQMTDDNKAVHDLTIEITDVFLGMQRILEPNSIDTGLLVPVWCFFGTEEYDYSDGSAQTYDTKVEASPIIVINAIDGTIINPEEGY